MLMPIPKRLSQLLLLLLLAGCAGAPKVPPVLDGPLVISTWPFGKDANDKAIAALASGRSLVDAVELGIRETERVVSRPMPSGTRPFSQDGRGAFFSRWLHSEDVMVEAQRGLLVTESACACSYYSSQQVQKTCKF